jgi:hypothetical protein
MAPTPPQTVDAVVLLGWMDEGEAVKYLLENCVFDPPITDVEARDIWSRFHDTVEQLPARTVRRPMSHPFDGEERAASHQFLQKHRTSSNVLRVVKVDPEELLVHQLYVVTDRSEGYVSVCTKRGWIDECLLGERAAPTQMAMRVDQGGYHVALPHGEFAFVLDKTGAFRIMQTAPFVAVTEFGNGMMLTAGYHRTFAHARKARNAPDAMGRSRLIALTTDVPFWVSPVAPNQGLRGRLLGARPPLFSDFFDARFFMNVKLRKKRFEMQVCASLVAIDA